MVLQALALLLPAAVANSVPPLGAKLFPKLNKPLDFGLTCKGKRIFGAHKTIRGFLFGVACAGLAFWAVENTQWYSTLLSGLYLPWHYGFITGGAALIGDALKSFFKRQLNIDPGVSWIPFDQIDWVICYLVALPFYTKINLTIVIISLFIGFIGQIITKLLGYKLGINDTHI